MNKKLINWWIGGSSYTAELQSVIARWTSLGYTQPSSSTLTSLDTLVTDLKGYGIWSLLDCLWVPMLGDSSIVSTTGTINFISPSANALTFPVAPNYANSGFKGNGTGYASTNYNPSTQGVKFLQDSASFGYYAYDGGAGATIYSMGASGGSANALPSGAASLTNFKINSSGAITGGITANNPADYLAIDRQDANNISIYVGTSKNDRTVTSAARPNNTQNILNVPALGGISSAGIAMAFFGGSMTQTQHSNFRTAIMAHKSRMGL